MSSLVARWRTLSRMCAAMLALFAGVAASSSPAQAQIGSDRYSSLVVDAASGNILSAASADELRYPASLTKMMTLYMLFEALRDRRVNLNQLVPISEVAASMSPTKLGLVPGSSITVEQCILGLVTKSANDAAAALGEMLGGDEDRFGQMMTLRARALGMTRTQFRNASGLPDGGQFTTARDMAILARHLIQDFPGFYPYFSTPAFTYAGRIIRSHQHMLTNYAGADGLKTGYIEASGYNIVTSAQRSGVRLIGVVLGAGSNGERDAHMAMLLDAGFERMGVQPMIVRREPDRMPAFITLAHAAPPPPRMAPPSRERYAPERTARRAPEPRRFEPRGFEPRTAIPVSVRPAAARDAPVRVRETTAHFLRPPNRPYGRYPG